MYKVIKDTVKTKSGHNINYGLWVIMTYQDRFTDCNKGTTLVG